MTHTMQSTASTLVPDASFRGQRRRSESKAARLRRTLVPWAFLLVPVGLLVLLTYVPAANMVGYSFTNWDGISKTSKIVGINNYTRVFTEPELFQVFFVSLYYLLGAFVQMGLALFFATILSFKVRAAGFFKGVIFFPYLINGVAIGMVFLYFFQPGGTLDTLLNGIGLGLSLIHI